MNKNIRVIPRLDIKGPNLVKGVHYEGLRVLGKPWDFAYKYYLGGADELIYIDVVASLYGRNNLSEIIEKTAKNIFIPFTVGGGIRNLDDIRNILRAGADKVAINTAAIHNPGFIKDAAKTFGSQCIVASIQAKFFEGEYMCFTDNAREVSNKRVFEWVKEVVDLGAGEILLTSVDQEGTGTGYDIPLISRISKSTPVPVIACGGCGNPQHMVAAIKEGCADAICAASFFHYNYLEQQVDNNSFKVEGNIEFIKQNRGSTCYMKDRIASMEIKDVKKVLWEAGLGGR